MSVLFIRVMGLKDALKSKLLKNVDDPSVELNSQEDPVDPGSDE